MTPNPLFSAIQKWGVLLINAVLGLLLAFHVLDRFGADVERISAATILLGETLLVGILEVVAAAKGRTGVSALSLLILALTGAGTLALIEPAHASILR